MLLLILWEQFLPCVSIYIRILKFVSNLIIVNTHAIRPQVLLPNSVHIFSYKSTEMVLNFKSVHVNTKCLEKLFWCSDFSNTILLLVNVYPRIWCYTWCIHMNDGIQSFHSSLFNLTDFCTIQLFCILPEKLYFSSLSSSILTRVVMKTRWSLWGIVVVALIKCQCEKLKICGK